MRVARPRLELGSRASKAPMLDRYTTGLSDGEISLISLNVIFYFPFTCQYWQKPVSEL